VEGQGITYGYDSFNRLASTANSSGLFYSYAYDRYGNRWSQTPLQGGSTFSETFNTANNQISGGGFTYDAAGNLTSDGTNTYTYDAEGNLIQQAGNGITTQYTYNAVNQQVVQNYVTYGSESEVVFDKSGQLASLWLASNGSQLLGKAYWGATPIESYNTSNNMAFFAHRDWVGTSRAITNATGAVTDLRSSLSFGDDATNVSGGRNSSFDGFTGLWDGGTSATNHAQFREYWNAAGRWLQPDPYSGSYDPSNPQSFDRYAYVLNNPLSNVDPSGLNACVPPGANYWRPGVGAGGVSPYCSSPSFGDADALSQQMQALSMWWIPDWEEVAIVNTGEAPGQLGSISPIVGWVWEDFGEWVSVPIPQIPTAPNFGSNNGKQNPCGTNCHSPVTPPGYKPGDSHDVFNPCQKATILTVMLGWGAGPWLGWAILHQTLWAQLALRRVSIIEIYGLVGV
jgi:RHS repeat-associated protein